MARPKILLDAHAPRNVGIVLVLLGIGMLAPGIVCHVQFMRAPRKTRAQMHADGLIHGESPSPPSLTLTLIMALALLLLGIAAMVDMVV